MSKNFMNHNDVLRFAAFMLPFRQMAALDDITMSLVIATHSAREVLTYSEEQLAEVSREEQHYACQIDELLTRYQSRMLFGDGDPKGFIQAMRFAMRPYLGLHPAEVVEEMRWRYTQLKNETVPTTMPWAHARAIRELGQHLNEWTDKMKRDNQGE